MEQFLKTDIAALKIKTTVVYKKWGFLHTFVSPFGFKSKEKQS